MKQASPFLVIFACLRETDLFFIWMSLSGELPAIRTKVQVLLHPVLEEKKAILEEYNWEHPLDLVLIATGNPEGLSHVNEVPRPLLDRLELIYMDLPEETVEKEIMLREKFRIKDYDQLVEKPEPLFYPALEELERRAALPWWIMDLVNKAVRHSRICRWLDKKASIRGTTKGLDHTYASVELENRKVANLKDAYQGLKLALRGRIGLRADLIDFEKPGEGFGKTDQVTEDLLWNALENLDFHYDTDQEKLTGEITSLSSNGLKDVTDKLQRYQELNSLIEQMKKMGQEKVTDDLNETENKLFCSPDKADREVLAEYNYSALETLVNLAWHKRVIKEEIIRGKVFIPQMAKW